MPKPRKKPAAKSVRKSGATTAAKPKKAPRARKPPRRRPTATLRPFPRPGLSTSSSSSRRPRPRRSTSISARTITCSPATATSATSPPARRRARTVAGIDINNGWKLRYVVDDGSEDEGPRGRGKRKTPAQILDEIKREAAKANRVLLASDPDREGESIAWHIADELKLPDNRTFRIRFNEITKTAVQQALANPEKIDQDRVAAQEARRAMDRVVGFPLSNLLGKKVAGRLSAGRVQSVAVKLIVDREREIEAFKTEEYWKITALLAPQGEGVAWTADPAKSKIFAKKKGEAFKHVEWHKPTDADAVPDSDEPVVDTESETPESPVADAPGSPVEKGGIPTPPENAFLAELAKWDGAEPKVGNEPAADAIVDALSGVPFVVSKVEQKDRQDRPQRAVHHQHAAAAGEHPAALQHEPHDADGPEAVRRRRASGMGQTALITYMRTDSTRVSDDALAAGARPHPGRHRGSGRSICPRSRTSTRPARAPRRRTRRSGRPT